MHILQLKGFGQYAIHFQKAKLKFGVGNLSKKSYIKVSGEVIFLSCAKRKSKCYIDECTQLL